MTIFETTDPILGDFACILDTPMLKKNIIQNKNTQGNTNDNSGKSQQNEGRGDSKNESRGLRETIETMFGRNISDILREGRTNETISARLRGVCKRWMEAKCSGLRYDARILKIFKIKAI